MSRLKILSNLKREEGTWLDYVALRGHTIITLAHKGTLPVKMFGPFWSVWCKIALAEVGMIMIMSRPCPSSSRLLKPLFKSHNFFIMEK